MDYKFHYHPEKNWINDPNGLCYFKNKFHIYYQYNPYGKTWGNICWGHATTNNFIDYKEEDVALKNDKDYDSDGCFSGNGIVIDDKLYVYYTSVKNGVQSQSVAYSTDGYNFIKYDKNPIITTKDEARDPYVFYYNDKLYMLLGTNNKVLLYSGINPFNFKLIGTLIELDEFPECPNLVKINDKYILKYSSMKDRKDHFYIGSFNGFKFINGKEVKIKMPKNYYASQIFMHNNSPIIIGWIFNDNYKTDKCYNGVLSIPRILYLDNNILKTRPINSMNDCFKDGILIDNDIVEEL